MAKEAHKTRENPVIEYFKGALEEFGKITWPTKEQAVLLTGIVVAVTAVTAVLIAIVDLGLSEAYEALLRAI